MLNDKLNFSSNNGHDPEMAQNIKTREQVVIQLFEAIIDIMPTDPDDMIGFIQLRMLLEALKEMEANSE